MSFSLKTSFLLAIFAILSRHYLLAEFIDRCQIEGDPCQRDDHCCSNLICSMTDGKKRFEVFICFWKRFSIQMEIYVYPTKNSIDVQQQTDLLHHRITIQKIIFILMEFIWHHFHFITYSKKKHRKLQIEIVWVIDRSSQWGFHSSWSSLRFRMGWLSISWGLWSRQLLLCSFSISKTSKILLSTESKCWRWFVWTISKISFSQGCSSVEETTRTTNPNCFNRFSNWISSLRIKIRKSE